MKITLIHNPEAGNGGQHSGEDLTRLIESAGHAVRYQSCKRADWRDSLRQPADLVAIAGGDGIVGKTAKELVGRGVAFTILPMGTANNIAASLKLRGRDLGELIAGWDHAPRARFDIGVATGPWGTKHFCEGLGIGAFTETMSRLDARKNVDLEHQNRTDKKIESVLHIMRIRLDGAVPPVALKLELDGVEFSGEYILVEAMNIRSIGPNLELAPNAHPGDGLIDVVLVTAEEKETFAAYLTSRIAGGLKHPELRSHRVTRLRIEADEMRLHIDDDVWPEHGDHPPFAPMIIDVATHPQALEVLLPS